MYLRRLLYISAHASDLGIKALSYKKCCVSFASAYPPTLGCDDTVAIIYSHLETYQWKAALFQQGR